MSALLALTLWQTSRLYGKRGWTDYVYTYMQVYSLLIYEQFTTTPPEIHKYFVCKQKFFFAQLKYTIFCVNNVASQRALLLSFAVII